METQLGIRFQYTKTDKNYPSMSNVGDIFKSFQTVFNIVCELQGFPGNTTIKVVRIREGSIIAEIIVGIAKEPLIFALKKVKDLWNYFNAKKEREFLNVLDLPSTFLGKVIAKSPSKEELEEITGDKSIARRASAASHIKRARYWNIDYAEFDYGE